MHRNRLIRASACFLLLLFTYQVCFHAWVLQLAGIWNYLEMQERLTMSTQTLQLHIPRKEDSRSPGTRFFDQGREIQHSGKMYDILHIDEAGDELVITCVEDRFEVKLKQMLSGLLSSLHASPSHKDPGKSGAHLSPFLLQHDLLVFFIGQNPIHPSLSSPQLAEAIPDKFSPPPDCL